MDNIINDFSNGYINNNNNIPEDERSINNNNYIQTEHLSEDLHHELENDMNDILLLHNNLFTNGNPGQNNNASVNRVNTLDHSKITTPNIFHSPSVLDNLISPINNNNLVDNAGNINTINKANHISSNSNSPNLPSFVNMNLKIEKDYSDMLRSNSAISITNEKENVSSNNNNNNDMDNIIKLENDFNTLISKNIHFGKNGTDEKLQLNDISSTGTTTDPQKYLSIPSETLNFDIFINNLPQITRVENQLKLKIVWQPNLWDKFIVHLPTNSIIKEKFYLTQPWNNFPDSFKKHLLLLETFVLDAHDLSNIPVCSKCVNREKRRASRRKSGMNDNDLWCMDPNRNAMVFNNKQLVTIKHTEMGDCIELNTRILCYCRHHKANDGFKLLFVLKDGNNNVIARNLTEPIHITDKKLVNLNGSMVSIKKDSVSSTSSVNTNYKSRNNSTQLPMLSAQNNNTNKTINKGNENNFSIQSSYSTNNNEEDEDEEDDNYKSVNSHTNTNLGEDFLMPISDHFLVNNNSNNNNNSNSNSTGINNMIPQHASPNEVLTLRKHIPSPTSLDEISESLTNSLLNSRRVNHSRNSNMSSINNQFNDQFINGNQDEFFQNSNKRSRRQVSTIHDPAQFNFSGINNANNNITKSSNASDNATNNTSSSNNTSNVPTIQRVIPSKGPINGGIEVTLLGSNFKQGLIVKFGNNIALSSQCWSDSTILTYLPPASVAGQVFVTITETDIADPENGTNVNLPILPQQRSIFTYVDETDRQLIELALQIVGLKMNGKLEDAKNIAKRIVDDDTKNSPSPNQTNNYNTNQNSMNMGNNQPSSIVDSDEDLIIKVIKRLNKTTSNLNMCDPQGRTLLHLASLKGYIHLISVLVKSGCNIDYKDIFGYTALHFAAIAGNYKILQLLIVCQAKINALNCNKLTPKDLYLLNHSDNINDKIVDLLVDTDSDIEYIDNSEIESVDNDFTNINQAGCRGVINDSDTPTESEIPYLVRKLSNISVSTSILDENDVNEPLNLLSARASMVNLQKRNSKRVSEMGDKFGHSYTDYTDSYSEFSHHNDRDDGYENSSEYDSRDEFFNESEDFSVNDIDEDGIENYINNHRQVTNEDDTTQVEIGNDADENNQTDSSQNLSLWNRMINIATEDLPKYDDLFPKYDDLLPKLKSNLNKGKQIIINQTNTLTNNINHDDNSSFNRNNNSSEDEYDMIQRRFNPFLQKKLDFHKDKMLLFFWLPLMVLILTCMIWMHFNQNDNNFIVRLNAMFRYYIGVGLGKFYLGNERMKTVFRDGISNLQTSGILNDLIVS